MRYQGSCHCGDIRFEANGDIGAVIECNCSYCSRKGSLLWFIPRSQFTLQAGEGKTALYQFNRHRIEHRFCPNCGVQAFAFGKDASGAEIAAINVRCLENLDLATLERHAYDGKSA